MVELFPITIYSVGITRCVATDVGWQPPFAYSVLTLALAPTDESINASLCACQTVALNLRAP